MGEQRADMVSRSIIISLAIIALAHAVPRSADVVVPEDNAVSPAQSSLLENIGKITKEADKLTHSTHGSSTQVDEQSKQIGSEETVGAREGELRANRPK